jgi:hypothetical protein
MEVQINQRAGFDHLKFGFVDSVAAQPWLYQAAFHGKFTISPHSLIILDFTYLLE